MNAVSLFIGLRYTWTRRRNRSVSFISAIAMTGIVLGVALLITVLSVMNGFDRELKQRILNIMPQVTLYHRNGISDWPALREQLLQMDRVEGAAPFVELQGMLHKGRQTQPVLIYGIDAIYESSVSTIDSYLPSDALQELNDSHNVIALGNALANTLGVAEGDSLTVIIPRADAARQMPAVRQLSVIATFNTATEVDNNLALMGLSGASNLSPLATVSGLRIKVDDLFAAAGVADNLRSGLSFGFYTSDWTRTHGNIYTAIRMSKNMVSLLLLLIIAIAAFNVVSTLVMVVVDKQGDIAVLRTLGMSDREVMVVFIIQGAVIGMIGTLIGVFLGVLLAVSVDELVAALESLLGIRFLQSDIYPISFLPSSLHWPDVLLVAGVSLAMSLVATIYPARKAAAVQPAEALRYD